MKKFAIVLAMAAAMCCGSAIAQNKGPAKTLTEVYDHSLSQAEAEFVGAADAMPEDKYDFAPTNGDFKGVRTFAQQVKHVAAVNYMVGGVILGEKPPAEVGEESGPANVKSKAEIMKYLKDSFAYAHKALLTINDQTAVAAIKSPWGPNEVAKGSLAMLIIAHPFDHYGQMVEYLRMNNIIPPASRGQ